MDSFHSLIVLLGPTASGKTALGVSLAKRLGGAIISADSRQVFKGMDLGTGKDLAEYGTVPYYLIDIREAGEGYDMAHFQDDFQEAMWSIQAQRQTPILCGGTGLYIQSVLQGFSLTAVPPDEVLRANLAKKDLEELEKLFLSLPLPPAVKPDIGTKKRLIRAIEIAVWAKQHPDQPLSKQAVKPRAVFGIALPVEERRARITRRLKDRVDQGLIEEVRGLMERGIAPEKLIFYGLEYKYVTAHLLGELTFDELFTKLNTEIHRYAKRQMTYFRKMEKDGIYIHWLDGMCPKEQLVAEILEVLARSPIF